VADNIINILKKMLTKSISVLRRQSIRSFASQNNKKKYVDDFKAMQPRKLAKK
jgi:hypothetical protein